MSKLPEHCPRCIFRQVKAAFAANDDNHCLSVFVHCDCVISKTAYVTRIGKALVAFDKPRRQIPDWSWDVITHFDHAGGQAFFHDGSRFDLAGLPDDPFTCDASQSDVRDLLGYAVREPSKLRQECRSRVRILSLALAIARPDLVYKFDL